MDQENGSSEVCRRAFWLFVGGTMWFSYDLQTIRRQRYKWANRTMHEAPQAEAAVDLQ